MTTAVQLPAEVGVGGRDPRLDAVSTELCPETTTNECPRRTGAKLRLLKGCVQAINVCVHLAPARSSFVLSTPSCDRTHGTGTRREMVDFRDCCRDILVPARLSTNDGGVGAGAGGPCWSHDALGAVLPALLRNTCHKMTHSRTHHHTPLIDTSLNARQHSSRLMVHKSFAPTPSSGTGGAGWSACTTLAWPA